MSKNLSTQNDAALNGTLESSQRLEAIKNLIFGENIVQIDQDFQSLKKLIDKRKDELDNYIEDIRKELNATVDNLSTDLNIRLTDLENTLNDKASSLERNKVDRKLLGTLLINLGDQIMTD